jgi:hypothetical protein
VSVAALFAWALATIMNVGEAWVPWVGGAVVVLAIGSNAFRLGLRSKDVVWTEELQIEQQRRIQQMVRESMLTILLGLGIFVSINLVREDILPQWVGGILFFAILVAWFWLQRVVRRNRI